ncbi:connector enhancer of kinase suppressor of ras 1 isoform X1 [Lepisosteus oculatus]|uniref:connector enhancer of kinase suppressor of ras 1 isoform X1 n=2 Tax=Lepisosteus oculatus TaxID=7918 RepID=UPI0035F51EAA
MEPIASWSHDRVKDWLKGLEPSLQQYPFEEWHLTGQDLLQLSYKDLEGLGVKKIGHQELLLEAVEKLCSLNYGMSGESMRSVTEKLRGMAHSLQMGIQSRWRVNTYNGQSVCKLPSETLVCVIELIVAVRGCFSWLNRYLCSQPSDYIPIKDIISHCTELSCIVHKDINAYEKEKDIISICRKLVAICDDVLSSCPENLLNHTTSLESVDLVPASTGDNLGIEITSTGSSLHYVTGTAAESPAEVCEKILAGDEVIQVNNQVVVGWTRRNLVKKLQENPHGVTLVLKKVPVSVAHQERAAKPSPSPKDPEVRDPSSVLQRVAASVRTLSFKAAVQEEEVKEQKALELELGDRNSSPECVFYSSHPSQGGEPWSNEGVAPLNQTERADWDTPKSASGPGDSPVLPDSPQLMPKEASRASVTSRSSCPEMAGQLQQDEKRLKTKGTLTAMSRRRVSCRELGRADCDGWLWKKKKDSGVFVAQKWQRFWFVLKGPSLYWYASQQEEKAEGLIHISAYSIESAGEHKRKYVFKVCHERFQTFFFAADNVSDMSKWINYLITAIQKHKKDHNNPPNSEEDCYSETEPEDEGPRSPGASRRKAGTKKPSDRAVNTLPRMKVKDKQPKKPILTQGVMTTASDKSQTAPAPEDEMGILFHRLKEGGVSLIGNEQLLTRDHFRKSFIKRCKNPVINEKIHTLRMLQSTLKAKESELVIINKILDDPRLTSEKFREWKQRNEELCQEIAKLAKAKRAVKGATPGEVKGAGEDESGQESGLDRHCPSSNQRDALLDASFRVRLTQGEQLVDSEPAGLDVESCPMETDPADTLPSGTANVSSDNYFFI